MQTLEIPVGIYKHFKGAQYKVFGCVRHTETNEVLVLYGRYKSEWVRPLDNFLEMVEHKGEKVPRFELVATLEDRLIAS